jgi:hypothetical protein
MASRVQGAGYRVQREKRYWAFAGSETLAVEFWDWTMLTMRVRKSS